MDGQVRTSSPTVTLLTTAILLVVCCGAQCLHRPQYNQTAVYGPRVLTDNPSLGDVIQVVNANSALIRSLYTTDATMSVPGAPSLRANLALERQKKLRLRAETAITGAEVDMGSNDELFWFWVRRNPPPTLYYCRHEKFATSAARQIVPVDPEWLLDALGLATFDPYQQHSNPTRTTNGNLEIRTTFTGPQGPMTKATIVDASRGFILEQHLFDARGTLVASAIAGRHWRDPGTGAIVPQQVKINWPATQFSLEFDVKQWQVNNIPADPVQLFTMPNYPGWAVVDLSDPNFQSPAAPGGTAPTLGGAPRPTADLIGFAPGPPAMAPASTGPSGLGTPGQSPTPMVRASTGMQRY
ncbi:MAG: hypothetical protein C0483_17580 [Pirellula sp.]|nr:hypothetical protein [Pirellula sp.]